MLVSNTRLWCSGAVRNVVLVAQSLIGSEQVYDLLALHRVASPRHLLGLQVLWENRNTAELVLTRIELRSERKKIWTRHRCLVWESGDSEECGPCDPEEELPSLPGPARLELVSGPRCCLTPQSLGAVVVDTDVPPTNHVSQTGHVAGTGTGLAG